MTSLGVMLLVASATTGFDGKAHTPVRLFRHSAVADGPAPPGGPMMPARAWCPDGAQPGRRFPNVKSQVVFFGPAAPAGPAT